MPRQKHSFYNNQDEKMAKNNDSKEQISGASTLQMMDQGIGLKYKRKRYNMFWLDTAEEFVFNQLPTSLYLSRRFAKKVLLIGISHICRERLKFSKDEFILRTAGDTKVLVRQKSTTIFDDFFN